MAKFACDSGFESWVFSQLPDTNIAYVGSAYALVVPIAHVSRERFMDAIRCGSCHAYDVASYWDGSSKRGGATRLAFHSDTVASWAYDDVARISLHRQQNAASLNARTMTTSTRP